ncbi:MAG: NAD(P)H-dependent oxidoreductase subunit E [Proteobacteria bacterium]|nr:NAD(P)H-dependent oxidoreductase subunit E [Pseudomonadota bacterium]
MESPVRWNDAEAQAIIDRHKGRDGATLPILHALQARFGFVDRAVIPVLAEALNLSKAEIHGVLTFYHDFRDTPPQGRVIRLCRAEACQSLGVEAMLAEFCASTGMSPDQPSAEGVVIETVYCLGNCALGPAALVEGELVGRVDCARLEALVAGAEPAAIAAGEAV